MSQSTEPVSSVPGSYPDGIYGEAQPPEPVSPSAAEKMAPVQGYTAGIPWSMHLRAYDVYCKRFSPQRALIEGWCRGGFGVEELDMFIPGWREELSEMTKLKAENARLTAALAEKNVELYGIRACGEKARRNIELPDGRPDNSDAAVWERACAYWSSNALSIQAQLASQQEALSAAADALERFEKVHRVLNGKDGTFYWRCHCCDGVDFKHTPECLLGTALARVNACLPEGTK